MDDARLANIELRITKAEDRLTAVGALAMHLFQQQYPAGPKRRAARERLTTIIESLFDAPDVPQVEAMHVRLQRVLGHLEEWTA